MKNTSTIRQTVFAAALLTLAIACKKDIEKAPVIPVIPVIPTVMVDTIPTDPADPASVGFFMERWLEKSFSPSPQITDKPLAASISTTTITVNTGKVLAKIPANFFGNNSNLWIGQTANETTLMNHLNSFKPGILRGPAGSVSDVFFFNANNNLPPADAPAELVEANGNRTKSNFWYGKNAESWTLSIDNYYRSLQLTNSTGCLTVNYGYARYGTSSDPVAAAAHLAADWIRYDNGRTKYWEVGNESFGDWEAGYRIDRSLNKDGQPEIVTGALYGRHFRVFADSMRAAAKEKNLAIKIAAVLYDSPPQSWNTETVKNWNTGVFTEAGNTADFFVVHSYFTNYNENSNADVIFNTAQNVPAAIKNYITSGMLAAGVAPKPVAMTEWNLFASGSRQNVSHVAGMHAVLAINEIIKAGYGAALRWDLANGWSNGDDHGLFSLGDEPDAVEKWTPRPAFYYMYYFQRMSGDRLLSSTVTGDNSVVSIATSFASGQKGVMLVNKSKQAKTVQVKFEHFTPGNKFYYYVLTGGTDAPEFSRMVLVNGQGPANGKAGGPALNYTTLSMNATTAANGIKVDIPERGVIYMVVDKR